MQYYVYRLLVKKYIIHLPLLILTATSGIASGGGGQSNGTSRGRGEGLYILSKNYVCSCMLF